MPIQFATSIKFFFFLIKLNLPTNICLMQGPGMHVVTPPVELGRVVVYDFLWLLYPWCCFFLLVRSCLRFSPLFVTKKKRGCQPSWQLCRNYHVPFRLFKKNYIRSCQPNWQLVWKVNFFPFVFNPRQIVNILIFLIHHFKKKIYA